MRREAPGGRECREEGKAVGTSQGAEEPRGLTREWSLRHRGERTADHERFLGDYLLSAGRRCSKERDAGRRWSSSQQGA